MATTVDDGDTALDAWRAAHHADRSVRIVLDDGTPCDVDPDGDCRAVDGTLVISVSPDGDVWHWGHPADAQP